MILIIPFTPIPRGLGYHGWSNIKYVETVRNSFQLLNKNTCNHKSRKNIKQWLLCLVKVLPLIR